MVQSMESGVVLCLTESNDLISAYYDYDYNQWD